MAGSKPEIAWWKDMAELLSHGSRETEVSWGRAGVTPSDSPLWTSPLLLITYSTMNSSVDQSTGENSTSMTELLSKTPPLSTEGFGVHFSSKS